MCDTSNSQKGASGLSADFVLGAAIVKQMHGFSYEQLAFHLLDSQSFRSFVRHPLGWMPNKSTLQRNISKISEASWKEINTVLVGWAAEKGLEKGQRIRLDSTAVESDIHHPTDSALLYDAVRTVSRALILGFLPVGGDSRIEGDPSHGSQGTPFGSVSPGAEEPMKPGLSSSSSGRPF